MDKRRVKPEGFEDFRFAEVYEPEKEWLRLYDIEHKIIWINTAKEAECNVVKLEPKKW